MTYIVSNGALNSTHSLLSRAGCTWLEALTPFCRDYFLHKNRSANFSTSAHCVAQPVSLMSAQRNETETKQFQNIFETVSKYFRNSFKTFSKLFCFSFVSLCVQFNTMSFRQWCNQMQRLPRGSNICLVPPGTIGNSDGQITNQITSTNHKSFAKMIQIKTPNQKSNHK